MAAHGMAHMFASASSGRDVIASLAEIGEDLERLARDHNQAKQRGLYADLADGAVVEPASITMDEARHTVSTVRGLFDHGAILFDREYIAWLTSEDPDVLESKNMFWGALAAGVQQGTPEGMFASLRDLYDEIGATEGFPQMIREQAAIAGAVDHSEPSRRDSLAGGDMPIGDGLTVRRGARVSAIAEKLSVWAVSLCSPSGCSRGWTRVPLAAQR